jgi:hypothetical protein
MNILFGEINMLFFSTSLSRPQYTRLEDQVANMLHSYPKPNKYIKLDYPRKLKAVQRIIISIIYVQFIHDDDKMLEAFKCFDTGNIAEFAKKFEVDFRSAVQHDEKKKEKILAILNISHVIYEEAECSNRTELLFKGIFSLAVLLCYSWLFSAQKALRNFYLAAETVPIAMLFLNFIINLQNIYISNQNVEIDSALQAVIHKGEDPLFCGGTRFNQF